jgi:hypothetical protein
MQRPFFLRSAVAVLMAGVTVLLVASLGNLHLLQKVEPLLSLRQQTVMLMLVAVQVVAVLLVLWRRSSQVSLLVIGWVSSSLLAYQVGLWFATSEHPASCLQIAASTLFSRPRLVFWGYQLLLIYLAVGSYYDLFHLPKNLAASSKGN